MKVLISPLALKKLQLYALYAPEEISGLGYVEVRDGDLCVTDVFLLEQVCSPGNTIIDRKALASHITKAIDEGKAELKLWWHSHGDGMVGWSGKDEKNIEEFDLEQDKDNWLLSIVVNKGKELKARLDIFSPLRLTLNDLPWDIEIMEPDLTVNVLEEIHEKVKRLKRSQLKLTAEQRRKIEKATRPKTGEVFLPRGNGEKSLL